MNDENQQPEDASEPQPEQTPEASGPGADAPRDTPQPESDAAAGGPSAARGNMRGDADYGAANLEHLSDLEHVREWPSMYIGDTGARGLHHLVYEVVDNSIDEAMAGYANNVSVVVNNDGSVTVEDDGRGIPVERHEQLSEELGREVSTLEGVMTVLKFGGKFSKGAYQTSGGLCVPGVNRLKAEGYTRPFREA